MFWNLSVSFSFFNCYINRWLTKSIRNMVGTPWFVVWSTWRWISLKASVVDKIQLELFGKNVLNFTTPKAYEYFVKCKDNHIAWQSVQVLLLGTIMERYHVFEEETCQPLYWLANSNWQPYTTSDTWNFSSALVFFQRVGDLFNNIDLSMSAKSKFMDMFYAFRNPMYQEVEYRDLCKYVLYPEAIRELRRQK